MLLSIIFYINTKLPTPEAAKEPNTMTDRPPCLTVGMRIFAARTSLDCRQMPSLCIYYMFTRQQKAPASRSDFE